MNRLAMGFLALLWPLMGITQDAAPVDYASLAKLTVQRAWHLAPGERVVMFWDRASDRGMAEALRAAIVRAGGTVEDIAAPLS